VDEESPDGKPSAQKRNPTSAANLGLALDRETLGNLAHELRTPVQVLIGYLDMLRDDVADEVGPLARDLVDRMHANIHDLAQTVDNLMEFVMSEAQAFPNLDENINIAGLIGEVQPAMEAANLKKNLALRFDVSEAPVAIRAPRRALRSVILNLALNAIKFTESGGIVVAIREAAMAGQNAAVEVEVDDSGPGMSPAMPDRAREPFVQLSGSTARRHRGLGLGLTMVQRHVTAMGGTVELRSKDEQGTSLIVRVPVRAVRATGRRGAIAPPLPSPSPRKPPPDERR
jgi:signal transduction histidine kinase